MTEPQAAQDREWQALLTEQVRGHSRLFFRLAHGILREPQAAEDVCQQALLAAWSSRDRIRSGESLRAWICRTIVNQSLQVVRRRKVEQRALIHRVDQSRSQPCPPDRIELREALFVALERLPEQTRLVVAMRVMDGRSGNEVSQLLGCSVSEVSRQLHQGLDHLRGVMREWH